MKQLLFLLLFPCLAMAQYQGNDNQKITLGEQSTADGLVWRGILADTLTKIIPFSDTSAYIILDTVEKTFWLYKGGQIPKWQQIGVSSVSRITFTGSGSAFTSTVTDSTSTPKITINVPSASIINSGVVSTSNQTFKGEKTFSNGIYSQGLGLFGPQNSDSGFNNILGSVDGSVGFVRITNGLTLAGDSLKNGLVLTTSGSSGAATFNGTTLNIPNYIPSGVPTPTGTVEAIYSGTGINVSPNPITSTGFIHADTNFLITRFDTAAMLAPYAKIGSGGGSTLDTATMLLPYYRAGRNGIIQESDVPTLNQNTTGSAATLTTARNITTNLASAYGANFDGSANITPGVTGVLGAGNGGTGASNFGSPNRIPFVSSSGSLTTDTFFAYNGTTQRLGVGVPSPTEKLHVDGNGLFTGSISLGTPLTVANGGTGQTTLTANKIMVGNGTGGVLTPTELNWDDTNKRLGIGVNNTIVPVLLRASTDNNMSLQGPVALATGVTISSFNDAANVGRPLEFRATMYVYSTGNVGYGVTNPTALLHFTAGTASNAPVKFTSGVNLTTPQAGAMEFNGTNLFFSPSTTRHTVNHGLTGSATLNFPSTLTNISADLTITVTGAADGDVVSLGVPNAAVNANTSYSAWVSAANTVTVRFNNYSNGTVDPASALFKVFVTK